MDLKKSMEKNPFAYVATCVIAAASLAAGVMQYFSAQTLTLEKERNQSVVADLNSKLASLRRGIPGSEFFDIRTLLYYPNGGANSPTSSSTFFPEDFYAAKAQPDWVYKETTELDLISDLFGATPREAPRNLQKAATMLPFHLWRSKNESQVEGSDIFKKVYPLVYVEKVTTQQMRSLFGLAAEDDDEKSETNNATAEQNVQKAIGDKGASAQVFIDSLDKAYQNDAIGTFFAMQLTVQLSAISQLPKTAITLVEIQKVGNVLYAQFLITLKDVRVGGHPYSEYYVRREMIVVSTPESAFVVGTILPSSEPAPRDPAFAAVSKWLNDFRIVI